MSTDLVLQNMNSLITMADKLHRSSLLPMALRNKPAEVLQILQMGSELGLKPMQSINSINVIQGKPTISSQLMIALIRQNCPNSFIKIEEDTDKRIVKCTMARDKADIDQAYTASWDMDKAKAMGMDKKDNYLKQPMTMLKWRSVSEAARFVFPDIIMGCYTPEELDQGDKLIFDQEGGVIGEKKEIEKTVVKAEVHEPELTVKEKLKQKLTEIHEKRGGEGIFATLELFNKKIEERFPGEYRVFDSARSLLEFGDSLIIDLCWDVLKSQN